MVHWAAMLARMRSGHPRPATLPVVGAALCVGLAIFQAIAVPEAGRVVAVWLGLGAVLYLTLLAAGCPPGGRERPGARPGSRPAPGAQPARRRARRESGERGESRRHREPRFARPAWGRILLLSVIPREGRPALSIDAARSRMRRTFWASPCGTGSRTRPLRRRCSPSRRTYGARSPAWPTAVPARRCSWALRGSRSPASSRGLKASSPGSTRTSSSCGRAAPLADRAGDAHPRHGEGTTRPQRTARPPAGQPFALLGARRHVPVRAPVRRFPRPAAKSGARRPAARER